MQLWFITPAFRRYALAEVCFDQWKQISAALALHGIELRVVVVSDDENLELARAAGFDTVERDNDWLGRRFNDGYEYACRHGADYVTGVGSDSWIDPEYFVPLPDPTIARRGRFLSVVTRTRLAELRLGGGGATPFVFHRTMLEPADLRPVRDFLHKGCDSSTIQGIRQAGVRLRWEDRALGQYQHISFRAHPHLTRYARLWAAYGVRELYEPWSVLAEHYPVDLVARARRALELDTHLRGGLSRAERATEAAVA